MRKESLFEGIIEFLFQLFLVALTGWLAYVFFGALRAAS